MTAVTMTAVTTTTSVATATATLASLTPSEILQAYDAQIGERRSDLEQLQDVRASMLKAHQTLLKDKQGYLDHLERKFKSRFQRGGDITTYSRVMESCYSDLNSNSNNNSNNSTPRPVMDVIRRQSMLLSVTHQCEVQQKMIRLTCDWNKTIAKSLMSDVSDLEDEKEQLLATFAKRRAEREMEMNAERQFILTTKIHPQRMVLDKLTDATPSLLLEEHMMARRRRQSKGIQQTLKERSENFKKMRQHSFEKAKQHRRKSFGSQAAGGDDDRSVGSNKSGWSVKSGWSARSSGRSVKSGKSNRGIIGRFFGRTSSTTLESETSSSPALMEISITKIPPSSAFLFMSGLGDELSDPTDFPTEVTVGEMTESSVDS